MATKGSVFRGLMDSWRQISGRRRDTDPGAEEAERREQQRRREPRLTLDRFGEEAAGMGVVIGGRRLVLRDVSLRGFRVELAGATAPAFAVGAELDVAFLLGELSIAMRVRVANCSAEHAGFEILAADPAWQKRVPELLDPVLLGKQLREIDPRFVKADRHGNLPRWFQGGPACDLFLWYSPRGDFLSAQLFFLGQVVDWSRAHGVRTGLVQITELRERVFAQSELFQLKSPPDGETLAVARRVLAAATLPDELRALLRC
jgi:hypothetical protein